MSQDAKKRFEQLMSSLTVELNDHVFNKVFNYLGANPKARPHLNPAFPFPKTISIGLLENYMVIEYVGPNDDTADQFETQLIYQPHQNLYDFLGIDLSHLKGLAKIPCNTSVENMAFFLGGSIDYLTDYFYDFTQIPADISMNGIFDITQATDPCVINNCTFFWTDKDEGLHIRHVDLLELFPFKDGNIYYHDIPSLDRFAAYIITNPRPAYQMEAHRQLNEFIHLVNLPDTNEPTITTFLQNNPSILQLAFGLHKLNPQIELVWQPANSRPDLKPDFLPERMDGFCDIMEFKLPSLTSSPIVGKSHREHPSYEVDKAIAQLDEYEQWCQQDTNKEWLLTTRGIKILHPVRYLIMGHSKDFTAEQRRQLRSKRNTVLFTYDEFVEMARYQVYRVR